MENYYKFYCFFVIEWVPNTDANVRVSSSMSTCILITTTILLKSFLTGQKGMQKKNPTGF